ncbi:MAG: hypothetical protein HN742_19590 [Lentisphaerae bacterium]|jgi:multimeric flavodoxin WrbA|nr:hypothetical protein [Lentisphaerota bacterium]MBT4820505.1 hypothetical protein [Lentisphaerota bacterium]MBT5608013.1 hypothetical protein [Lentisphaerota bacterium]MBT7844093.1 hypothetical protein [Lentisphaerota bacterium]
MRITVLSGSPKGDMSVTLQSVQYLGKTLPDHSFDVYHIGQTIAKLAKNADAWDDVIAAVRTSDAILWAFPLYVFLVPSQYKRFIELVSERGAQGAFEGKYAAALTTSINFFDHTAHNYIHGVCEDLGMRFVDSFSAGMNDLTDAGRRDQLRWFGADFVEAVETQTATARRFPPFEPSTLEYAPGGPGKRFTAAGKRVLVVVDSLPEEGNLARMIQRFRQSFEYEPELVSLENVDIKGGCLGCIRCGLNNECQYSGKDGFIDFYNEKIREADILVIAGTIRDRYLSWEWKRFFDRSFFNTHTPTMVGKQLAFIVSGPLNQVDNLRQILIGMTEWQEANLAGMVSDECADSETLDGLLEGLAKRLTMCADRGVVRPRTFLGVGGAKIFRDEIWGHLRFAFQADHKYYSSHGFYDFPQKDLKTRLVNLAMITLTKIPAFREEFFKRIRSEMIKPHLRILDQMDAQGEAEDRHAD